MRDYWTVPVGFACVFIWCLVSGCGVRSGTSGSELLDRVNEDKTVAYELLTQGQFQGVVDILSPWIEKNIGDPQVYAMTAKAQWKLGRQAEAVKNYEEALRIDYNDAYAHMELAQILMGQGKTGRALTEFELSVKYAARDPLPHYNYGLALHDLGQKKEALTEWKVAYSLDPGDPTYAEAVGIGLAGRDDAAGLPFFERADSLGANRPGFRNNFGLLLQRLGDYARAEGQFREALALDADNAVYRRNLGLLYMAWGRYEQAAAIWEDLFSEDPGNRLYRIYLARAQLGRHQYEAAIEILEDWAARGGGVPVQEAPPAGDSAEGPGLDEAYDILAMSYRGKGDLGRAAFFMRKALEIRPDRAEYLTNYGVILAESGNIAEAKELWRRAIEIDPENATARQNLSTYER
jgi:tetratricopeptide (TPR) repeat protein